MIPWPKKYVALKENNLDLNDYLITPIRHQDRFQIMQWRNDQIYHLRQDKRLTKKDQNNYFSNVVFKLFSNENPDQILFSFFYKQKLVGYGGLVHIDWSLKSAEISFVIKTSDEKKYFNQYWDNFIELISLVAFNDLRLEKIYTYSFNVRPKLYDSLRKMNFLFDKEIKNQIKINDGTISALVHTCYNHNLLLLNEVKIENSHLLFKWANDPERIKNSFNNKPIDWESHSKWFSKMIFSERTKTFILFKEEIPIGQIRFDFDGTYWEIDYSVDINYRSKGYGKAIIQLGINKMHDVNIFKARVKDSNIASKKIFMALKFKLKVNKEDGILSFYKKNINDENYCNSF